MRIDGWLGAILIAGVALVGSGLIAMADEKRPLMRDLMGINGHTVQFKPELYAPTCRLVRDYHGFDWDVGENTDYKLDFPFARNRVNWDTVYGAWKKNGFETDVCIMFAHTKPESWVDLPRDVKRYGEKFARFFGATHGNGLVSSVEIGNEPGNYDDETYRSLFESMARGVREGDPEMKIVTCNMTTGDSGKYAKSVSCIAGLEDLYDVLNIHVYAFEEVWPVWRRIHPESSEIKFLDEIRELQEWRDANAPGKPIWVTEFGWDACSKEPPSEGDASKFEDVSDLDQARYLVRGFFRFAMMGIDRAYIFFFNDSDEPALFAASGITRNYEPKLAFHAVAHLYRTLRDYRFARVVEEKPEEIAVYEFVSDSGDRIRVVWSPTGPSGEKTAALDMDGMKVAGIERMSVKSGPPDEVEFSVSGGRLTFRYDGSPVYIKIK